MITRKLYLHMIHSHDRLIGFVVPIAWWSDMIDLVLWISSQSYLMMSKSPVLYMDKTTSDL
jgi:hypothetical protein